MSEPSPTAPEADIRPIIRTAGAGNRSIWLFGGGLVIVGLLLFNALNARRQDVVAATARPTEQESGMIASPPPLSVPQAYDDLLRENLDGSTMVPPFTASAVDLPPPPQVITRVVERMAPTPAPAFSQSFQSPSDTPRAPVVIERPALAQSAAAAATGSGDRVTAGRLINPSLTVPQGTIIAAVLETALDSTRAGAVRAIVSRDVRSFDGSKLLIPRGSRLYGEYASDLSAGQKRALVRWQRLTRPDAVIINLDSPSADPLGRAGIAGKVDTHFFERFGGAILQSVLDVGVAVASRSVTDYPVVVALPGSSPQITGRQQQQQVQPTLKVQQGTSVSVFVARDLDFSTVDR